MSKKIWICLLSLLCIVGAALAAHLYMQKDREGPVITVPEDAILYQEGEDTAQLLKGVTAKDAVDGDVSDSLIVEGTYPSTDDTTAKIVYAAIDESNNVTKAERMVDYAPAKKETAAEETESESETEQLSTVSERKKDTETESEESESETEEVDLTARVIVLNGTEQAGVAASWQSVLEEKGFTDVSTGDYTQYTDTTLIYTADDALAAVLLDQFADAERVDTLEAEYIEAAFESADAYVVVGTADAT